MEKETLTEQDTVCQEILKAGMPIDSCQKCTPEKREICTGCKEKEDYVERVKVYISARNHEDHRVRVDAIGKLEELADTAKDMQNLLDQLPKELRDVVDPTGVFADSKDDKPVNPLIAAARKGVGK